MQLLAHDDPAIAAEPSGQGTGQGTGPRPLLRNLTLTSKLAGAMILLVALATVAVSYFSYRVLARAIPVRALERIETHARLVAAELAASVEGSREDLLAYQSVPGVVALMQGWTSAKSDSDALRDQVASRLQAEMAGKPSHAMVRLIGVDGGGRELVRIDRLGPGGSPRIAGADELERAVQPDLLARWKGLKPGEAWVSPVQRDAGGAETMLIAAPLPGPDGRPAGLVAVSLDMRAPLARARQSARPGEQIHVVDSRGNYLVHPDAAMEFGAQQTGWTIRFPQFAALQRSPGALIIPDGSGRPTGAAIAPVLLGGAEWVAVIETVPNEVLMRPAVMIRDMTLVVGFIAMLCAAGLAVLIARSLTRPIKQLTAAVEGIGRGESVAIPLDVAGETGVLAGAFADAMAELRAKKLELEREVQQHYLTEAARDHFAARERLYSAAVQSSNDAIITQSLDGTITGWNPAAEQMFGYTAEEAIGQNVSIIAPTDRKDEVGTILAKIGRGERIEQEERVRRHKNGTAVDVLLSISPIKSKSGEVIGVSKTALDITETKRTRQVLLRQAEELRLVFETSQDLIVVLDARGIIVQISPSCETILGYSPGEMIGRGGNEFMHPLDVELSRDEMRAARRGEHVKIADTRLFHKDGHSITFSWLGTWSGPVRRFFFVGRDTTEAKRAEETLRESAQLARNIIETALDAFIQMDEAGRILDWNSQAEAIFGWPREAILGMNLLDLIVVEDDRRLLKASLEKFLSSRDNRLPDRRREIMVRRRNGSEFRAELSVTALRTRKGILFNGFFRDLTEKIAAEERIRQAEKMEAIGQLTGGIAHDFNNILTVITGTIEILAGAVENEPQLAAITKMIDDAAARGADLTQHLLAFARRQPLQPREIDINALLLDTSKLLRPTLGERIEVRTVFEHESCLATVDPNQLATAIINLALNSRDAMSGSGTLTFETRWAVLDDGYAGRHEDVTPGRYAMIAVSDTGSGIPAAIIDKVFEPFFTSKGPGKGTGLGLSMVYGFVKQSAGHIKVYSEPGIGTTIRMYLPPGNGAALAPEGEAIRSIEGGRETILVVEDDHMVRSHALTQLRSLGYDAIEASNAAEAMSIIETGQRIDLLFTDMIMPGVMNGSQLAAEIRKSHPDLKVLFTSGYTENAIMHHGRLGSGVLLLAKPYRKSDMARMVRRALDGNDWAQSA